MRLFKKKSKLGPGYERHPDFPQLTGRHYLDVLSEIEKIIAPRWYLEIGSRSGNSISQRNCNFIAVDPEFDIVANVFNSAAQMHFMQMTSDAFFESRFLNKGGIAPDLTFIDGMHLFEYALRDFVNAERNMTKDGIICLHDTCPFNHEMATRDVGYLDGSGRPWTGDVWKVVVILKELRPDLVVDVLAARKTGLCVVSNLDPANSVLTDTMDEILARYTGMTLEGYGVGKFYDAARLCDPDGYLRTLASDRQQ